MTSEKGSSTQDATLRRRIKPWEFDIFFDPRQLRKETCLLYEIKWGTSHKVWRNSGQNTTKHVEVNFIEKFTSERKLCPSISCSITWFLSWSPCWECSKAIREFLRQHPNVTLVIYVARLFHHMDQRNRQGLKDLILSGITVQIMRVSVSSLLEEFCQLLTWGRNLLAKIPPSVDDDVCTGTPLHNSKSSTLFKDFKKMSASAHTFQPYSSKMPLPDDSTLYPFSYRVDRTSYDLEMNKMIPCVYYFKNRQW